jgi:hypothetical protein
MSRAHRGGFAELSVWNFIVEKCMRSDNELLELQWQDLSCAAAADHVWEILRNCTGEELGCLQVLQTRQLERSLARVKTVEAESRRQKTLKRDPLAPLQLSRKGQIDPILSEALASYGKEIGG